MSNIIIPAREVPVLAEADLVVVGGGSAGVAAAVAATQEGASCILIEKANCAGGMLTNGLLPSIIYMSDGKHLLSGGLCYELVRRVSVLMNVEPNIYWHNINPEAVKLVLDEMLCENNIRFFYNMYCCEVLRNDTAITGVVVSTPGGTGVIRGRFFVDATGDGNLGTLAGVHCEIGDENGEVMAPTLCSLWSGVDYKQHTHCSGLGRKEWHEAEANNTIPLPEHHFVGFFRCGDGLGCGNLGHEYGCRPLNADSYTAACVHGRKQVRTFLNFFRENVPGFANAELALTAPMLGVRESRRLCGEYTLCKEDYFAKRHFADDIGSFSYPVDIHASSTNAEEQANVEKNINATEYEKGENYGIPYRSLLAKGVENLLLAGRCISADRTIQSSIRVVPGCMITGEAAGTAAAAALREQTSLRSVDISNLQKKLVSRGIYLPETE